MGTAAVRCNKFAKCSSLSSRICDFIATMENNSQGLDLTIDEEETQKYQHVKIERLITEEDNKIGLTNTDLVVIKTKDLNNKLKQTTDLRREDKEKIKKKRRTLKNRGYAAGSRYKRNDEEKTLKNEKQKIEVMYRIIGL